MEGVNIMSVRMRGRLAGLGATAAAVTAIATVACVQGTAVASAARPAASERVTVVAARVAAAIPASYTPPSRTLKEGMKGADVKALQQRLAALKYNPGKVDGQFGGNTLEAVWAFQEVNGLKADGVIGPATKRALVSPRTYKSPSYTHKHATRVEVSQALEVLVLFKNNQIALISHVSTGGGYLYDCGSSGCARAVTPNGTYTTNVYMPGWIKVPLGEMYNSVFFIRTAYAIHGDTFVPVYPASHGCVRLPMFIASFFHTLIKTPGTQVHVYGKPQWEK